MDRATSGYLLIADITGYTGYMQASELDHARGILEGLFAAMLERLRSPFVLSNVQGDAILTHARAGLVTDGHSVIDTVEAVYFGFARALEGMIHNTTCTCKACSNIVNLDLKLLVHYGAYVDQAIGGRIELGGPEVILIHRLMKNAIAQTTGIRAYAAFTDAAANAIGVPEFFAPMAKHTENVERFDPVTLFVLDMQPLWKAHRAQEKVVADENDLFFPDVEVEIPAPLDRAWYYITNPGKRADWYVNVLGLTRSQTTDGRVQIGSVDHCAHGDGKTTVFTFLDWQPHEHVTFDIMLPFKGTLRETIFVNSTPTGTHLLVRTAKPVTPNPLTQILLRAMTAKVAKQAREDWDVSLKRLKALAAAEAPADAPPVSASRDEAINQAIAARLAGEGDADQVQA
jgi:uncharacterized protein YndB with AHSA1/START domain